MVFGRKSKAEAADDAAGAPLLPSPGRADMTANDYENASSWAEEDDQLSREKLQMIKARTMYEMVEEVELPGGPCKLLFLTNAQAEFLAHSDASLQKMLDALEVPKPQLVINLLTSSGFRVSQEARVYFNSMAAENPGRVTNCPPFLTMQEEQTAERRIDRFMADTLIPLAAQTNAIVIASPSASCILSASLMRMYALHRSMWGDKAPFTIISAGATTNEVYKNGDLGAVWREIRRQSRAWRARDKKLIDLAHQLFAKEDGSLPTDVRSDYDPNCSLIITTDMIEARKEASFDKGPFTRLLTNLVRYLGSSLPSLTLKAGACTMPLLVQKGSAQSGLDLAVDAAVSGSPVLFLDVRERPRLEAADRPQLIEAAKAALGAHCDALVETGLAESLISSTIAYAHEVLFGMPDGPSTGEHRPDGALDCPRALHEAIHQASSGGVGSVDTEAQGLKRATPQQAAEFVAWIVDRFFSDAFAILKDRAQREAKGETPQILFKDRALALQIWAEALLGSPNFQSINLCDPDKAARVVQRLVRLDRLPKQNSLEGLMLLQEAWESHDIAVCLADYYKGLSKFIFVLQLFIVWAVTVCTALGYASREEERCEKMPAYASQLPQLPGLEHVPYASVAFFGAIFVSLIISVDALLNAKGRWRQLRAGAGQLESMIWCYRTRVGDFELTGTDLNSLGPETKLRRALIAWRRNLMTGGDLKLSGFSRAYPPSTFTHGQFPEGGQLGAGDADDHYSPVQPQKYIELRVLPSIAFYKWRTPWYAREGLILKVALVLSTLAASVLTKYGLMIWVVGVTSGASALTSWQEYSDVGRKTMRYTHAVVELQNLLSWWKSTSEVERASKAAITQLIHTAEGVISEERLAWMSTTSSQHGSAEPDHSHGHGKGKEKHSEAGDSHV